MRYARPLLLVLLLLGALPAPFRLLSLHAEPPLRRDLYGDPLPPGAVARLGTLRYRVEGAVQAAAFSPDGKTVASLDGHLGKNTLSLWEAATGRLLHHCQPYLNSAFGLAFSPDGRLLATSNGDHEVWLWEVATGKRARVCRGDEGDRFFHVCFSPRGKRVAAAGGQVACVWEPDSGKRLSRAESEEEHLTAAFAPDGEALARIDLDRAALLARAATGELLQRDRITCLQVSPDGKTAACTDGDGNVWLWEAATGKPIRHDRRAEQDVTSLAFSPDGTVLAVGNGRHIDLYEVIGGKKLASCRGHHRQVTCLGFSPNGRRLLSGSEQTLRQWDAATGKPLGPEGHDRDVYAAAFCPDGRTVASAGEDGSVRLWDAGTGRQLAARGEHGLSVTTLSFSPDGKQLASTGGSAGALRVWEVGPDRQLRSAWGVAACGALDAVFSPDGATVAVAAQGLDGRISLRDAQSGKERRHWQGHPSKCWSLSYAPDGKTLASVGDDNTLRFWNVVTGRQLRARDLAKQMTSHRVLSCPAGRAWACTELPFLDLWDAAGDKRLRRLPAGSAFTFSPDGLLLATAPENGPLILYETATGKEVRAWPGHEDGVVRTVSFSPDGKLLVSGSRDSTLLVWNVDLLLHGRPLSPGRLTDDELESLWRSLAGTDALRAYRAVSLLAAAPEQAVPYVQKRLRPVKRDEPRARRLLADLDSNDFAVRDRARRQLAEMGEAAEADLEHALASGPPLEVRLSVERLLAAATAQLRPLRALAVLERSGTPAARQLLQQLAEGAEEARLTRAARAALRRMDRRAFTSPADRQP